MPNPIIGHYQISGKLGAGGMGEVFRATDTRLGREVAIKVLPDSFARDQARLARFQREAEILASLNHPNIGAIHGLEETEGSKALILELVEGETIAERLKRGAMPVEEALEICKQIAEALGAAHSKGIVHRDLKPGNVKVTADGKVKVLDFGLAKALIEFSPEESADSESPTVEEHVTKPGMILGTAAYMSPEQAKGKPIDKRTDTWAFGCVLYECLTGRRVFDGDSATDTMGAVLLEEPDWTQLPQSLPWPIGRLLRRCLSKDPKNRLQDIGDGRLEIEEVMTGQTGLVPEGSAQTAGPLAGGKLWWSAIGLGGLFFVAGLLFPRARHDPSPVSSGTVQRWNIDLPEEAPIALVGAAPLGIGQRALAISPDGKRLVYVGQGPGGPQIYLRPIDRFEAEPIPDTLGAYHPAFSPDGEWIAFFAEGHLKKIQLAGGKSISLCEVTNPMGATWASDNRIYFADKAASLLSAVSASGGEAQRIFAESANWPQLLPDEESLLINNHRSGFVSVFSLRTGEARRLVEGWHAFWVPSGYLVYGQGYTGRLMAVPFNLDRGEAMGDPFPVLDDLRTEAERQGGQFTCSTNGTLVYVRGDYAGKAQLVWVDRDGNEETLPFPARAYGSFRLSPDGKLLAIEVYDEKPGIWILDLARGRSTPFTPGLRSARPVWMPDGHSVTFRLREEQLTGLFQKAVRGVVEHEPVAPNLTMPASSTAASWAPDGKTLALSMSAHGTNAPNLWLLQLDDDPSLMPFTSSKAEEWGPKFSPDGRWLAYTSDETGRYEVYAQPVPQTGQRWQISTEGGEEPAWASTGDGLKVFYRNGTRWMSVAIASELEFSVGTSSLFLEGSYLNVAGPSYEVAPGGDRLLVLKSVESQVAPTQLNVVANWFEELKAKAPSHPRL